MRTLEFYICDGCGSIVGILQGEVGNMTCCGQEMHQLIANTTEASKEKHIPVAKKENGKIYITVGSAEHPMAEDHYIEWIAAVGPTRTVRQLLKPGDAPTMTVCDDNFTTAYAYCNKHGLWKGEL